MGPRPLTVLTLLFLAPVLAHAQGADQPSSGTMPPATEAAPAEQPSTQPPPPNAPPSSKYYAEPPPGGGPPPQGGPPPTVYEPPPPGYYPTVYEPPPPPKPHHVAPKTAFWLGARGGYFIPFGNLWLDYSPAGYEEVKWSEYASPGPMFELDIGMRFGRYYNVFLLWERASLGTGSAEPDARGGQKSGDTDYYAIGLRFSSDPDRVGFLTEIDIGYRRFRARWEDGSELRMTEAPLEFRIGLGADIRLSKLFSLSPLVTLGAGAFGDAEFVDKDDNKTDATSPGSEVAGHGWLTLQLGGHFDIAGGD